MVHADLSTPSNVLVRDGAVIPVVDVGNAGSGTRAIALTTLVWPTLRDPLLEAVRRRLWARILDLVGWERAAVLAASRVLRMLGIPVRHGRRDVVLGGVERGHRVLDELTALRCPSAAEAPARVERGYRDGEPPRYPGSVGSEPRAAVVLLVQAHLVAHDVAPGAHPPAVQPAESRAPLAF
jgi:hypothetical protein